VEREVVTSVYTALGFDGTTSRHVFYQRLLDNPAWTTNVLKQRTDVAETDIPQILTTLDPRDKSGAIHIGNSAVHSHTIGEATDFVQKGAMELLLHFIDGGDPSETLESAGYRVQTELAYAFPQIDEPPATRRENTLPDAPPTDLRILTQQVADMQMQMQQMANMQMQIHQVTDMHQQVADMQMQMQQMANMQMQMQGSMKSWEERMNHLGGIGKHN